jgi:uncharacterized Tic20 family protein
MAEHDDPPVEKGTHDDPPVEKIDTSATQDDRTMAMLCHLGGILGFIVPLIIWLVKKDQSRYVDYHGKEALNFQITMLIAHIVAGSIACFTFGLSSLAVMGVQVAFSIIGALAANRGEEYRYPLTIRFIT